MHTRYGHIRITEDSVNIFADNSQTILVTGDLTSTQTSTAKNFKEGVQNVAGTAVALNPSLGQMVKHSPAVGSGSLAYTFDAGWEIGESLTLHLFTDSDRNLSWPTTLWVDSEQASVIGTTGAHLFNIWKLDTTNFFAAYVGEAS